MYQCCCYCWYSVYSTVVFVVVMVVALQEPIYVVVVKGAAGCDLEVYL